jgi:DNA uptake protein ComE-like DNA-binding protein
MNNFWQKFIKDFFSWSRGDRVGIILLSVLVIVVLFVSQLIKRIQPEPVLTIEEMDEMLSEWHHSVDENVNKQTQTIFQFNPNTISSDALDSLLLPPKIKRNLIKYREAGGVFYQKEDVRKLYGMNDSIYRLIEDSIYIQPKKKRYKDNPVIKEPVKQEKVPEHRSSEKKVQLVKKQTLMVEINLADTSDLIALKGIGPSYAKRIIKYRELLGGYYKKRQLLEVYGMDDERFNGFQENIIVDTTQIRQLRINYASFAELLRHPYFSKEMVKSIMSEKDKHGPIKNISELMLLKGFDTETVEKLRPYILFD